MHLSTTAMGRLAELRSEDQLQDDTSAGFSVKLWSLVLFMLSSQRSHSDKGGGNLDEKLAKPAPVHSSNSNRCGREE